MTIHKRGRQRHSAGRSPPNKGTISQHDYAFIEPLPNIPYLPEIAT